MHIHNFGILALIISILIIGGFSVTVDEDLTLTGTQLKQLNKLKTVILPKLNRDYMKEDLFLLRFLRAKNFDVRRAADLILEDLKWRNDYKIDNVHNEDWSEFEKEYPVYTDGVDRDGRPICALDFGEWDVRKATGKIPRLIRWMNKCRDKAIVKVRELQKEGKNVTQFNFLANMDRVNLNQHMCVQCLQLYTEFSAMYEAHYPGTANLVILINTPQAFETVLTLVRPILAPQTRESLKTYGKNKDEWEPKIFATIEKDQLPPQFGGTRVYNS